MKIRKLIALVLLLGLSPLRGEAGELINEQLPDWVEMDVQFRYRYEHKADFDFNKNKDDDKGFSLKRIRFNLGLMPHEDVKFFYQFQDSRIFADSLSGSKSAFEDFLETRQLWAQYESQHLGVEAINLSKAGVRFGRQELSYGAQRLVGGFNWSNIAQTFDAGKVMLTFGPADLNVDMFWGEKTPNKTPDEADEFFDGESKDELAGYYATYKGLKHVTIEQYLLSRQTHEKTVSFGQTGDGDVEDYTLGGRIKGAVPDTGFDYEVEGAYQFGDSGNLDVSAAMFVGILGYTFDHVWKPRVSFEFDYASGDDNPTDGDRKTFDNLFPTNHLYYGYMDFASLQNLNNYHLQIAAKPSAKLKLQADLHVLYLDTAKDNLYSAGRAVKRATTPGAGSQVGKEIDILAKYQINDQVDILAGYSHFFAGDFLEDTGTAEDADFIYFQTTLSF
ncbi:MAG: alginate export family protein [Candidatus Omnitrophica bacterium]|nr:alginate export family protein [Candidatus Omnitrophota bacterium]